MARPPGSKPTFARFEARTLRPTRPGGHQKDEGHGHLGGHQAVAEGEAAAAGFGGRGLAAQVAHEVGPRGPQGRGETGEEAGHQGGREREGEHAGVEAQVEGERDGNGKRERGQEPRGPPGQRRSRDSAQEGQDDALHQELAHHLAPAGADGHADADLAAARRGPREQEGGHVRARDEQHEADQPHGRRRHGAQDFVGLRMHAQPRGGHEGDLAVLVGLRVLELELRHHSAQAGLRLLEGDSRPEAALQEQPAAASALEPGVAGGRGHQSWMPAGSTSSTWAAGSQTSAATMGRRPLKPASATPAMV